MKKIRFSGLALLGALLLALSFASVGCGEKVDRAAIDKAPPPAADAKPAATPVNKPGPVGGSDGVAGSGGSTSDASEVASPK